MSPKTTDAGSDSGARDEHARLAEAIRRLVDVVATRELPEPALGAAADAVDALAAQLATDPGNRPVSPVDAGGFPRGLADRSTVSGTKNPLAPPMRLRYEADRVVGEVEYGGAYEGAPGCVHGGHVALAFDHVAGRVAAGLGSPVLTGKLKVRYLKPTRLGRTIRYEARLRESRHRLVTVDCAAYDGDVRTASAEILFIELTPAYMNEVLGGAS